MRVYCGTAFAGQSVEGAPTEHWSEQYVDLVPLSDGDEEFLRNLMAAYGVPGVQLSLRPSPHPDREGATRFSLILGACEKPREEASPSG